MKIYCPRCGREITIYEHQITSIHATVETIRIDIYIEHNCNEYIGLMKSQPKPKETVDDDDQGEFGLE